jgi:hypothetical protein
MDARSALDPAALFEEAFGMPALGWQRDYLRAAGDVAILKGRQIGASLAAAALAIRTARYSSDVNAVIVSPSLKQSTEITTKARIGVHNLGLRLVQDSTSTLRLSNGSRILSLPGTARSVRGWSARLLILDEAAYIGPETWTAARALVATGGRTIVQSTPADETGDFHDLVSGDDPAWTRFTVRSDEVPTISAEFLEAQRRQMAPDAYATEFECQFGRAGARLFTAEQVDAMFASA